MKVTGSGPPSRRCCSYDECRGVLSVCPLFDGPKPHVGGVVAKGSATVLIGGMPAARMGDSVVEAGAPNSIAMGAPNVQIGG